MRVLLLGSLGEGSPCSARAQARGAGGPAGTSPPELGEVGKAGQGLSNNIAFNPTGARVPGRGKAGGAVAGLQPTSWVGALL